MLTTLSCSYNPLTELDVSQNTELTVLDCQSNQLTELDVSSNTKLTQLWCQDNSLTELDISLNTELTELHCQSNQLTKLDISKNTKLVGLLRQSRGQGVEVPGNGLVRQRDQAGEFIYSQPELDVLRQDHCHRLPDGNGRIAPPFKKGVLWAAGTFQVSDG